MSEPRVDQSVTARVGGRVSVPEPVEVTEDIHDVRLAGPRDRTIHFDGVTLERVDFTGSRFYHFAASGSRFIGCDFGNVRFRNAVGFDASDPTSFINCRFDRSDLRNMFALSTSRFERCSFTDCRIEGWDAWCAEFVDCLFACRIEGSIFSGRPSNCSVDVGRTRNEFRGNDFSQAELVGTDFRNGIDLEAQRWPDSPGYRRFDRWAERFAKTRAEVESWPPSKERSNALLLLKAHSPMVYGDQREVLLTPDAMGSRGRILRERLISILASA